MTDVEPTKKVDGKRSKWQLSGRELADCLMPFAKESGPSFLTYKDEAKNCQDAKVIHGPEGIEGSKEWLRAVHAINPSMQAPQKSTAVEALKLILEELKDTPDWRPLKPADLPDWEETMSRRLRNPIRVIGQAAVKKKVPPWVLECIPRLRVSWIGEAVEDDRQLGEAVELGEVLNEALDSLDKPEEDPFEYGLNDELMLPFRKRKGSDYCDTGLPIIIDPQARPEDEVVGKFVDGTEHTIGITNAEWSLKWPSQQCNSALYETEHKISKHKITIKQRPDRKNILMSIYEQGKQVLQVNMCVFGEAGSETLPKDHPTVVASLKFMTPLADLFAEGGHTPASIKVERDQRLKAEGIKPARGAQASWGQGGQEGLVFAAGETTAKEGQGGQGLEQATPKVSAKATAAKKAKVDKPEAKKLQATSSASAASTDTFDWPSMPRFDSMSLATKLFTLPK